MAASRSIWVITLIKSPLCIGVFSEHELAKEAVERYCSLYELESRWHSEFDFEAVYQDGFQYNAGKIVSMEIDMYYHGVDNAV